MVKLAEFGIDEKELTKTTIELMKNKQWLYENYQKLRNEYAHQYVAISDEKIIESDRDLNKLKQKLIAKEKNPEKILIELINPKEITSIL
ncbi:MAG: DUF5678 domain-containing protein [Candidatus Lokiarchaeia archaeon]